VTGVLPAYQGGDSSWVDYSSVSTVTGWSSTTIKTIRYQQHYKSITIEVYITGTSNSTSTSITLPVAMSSNISKMVWAFFGQNGGSYGVKAADINVGTSNSSLLTLSNGAPGTAWTNSGTKSVALTFTYETD